MKNTRLVPRGAREAARAGVGAGVPGRWTSLGGATAAQIGISYLEQGVAALVPYIKAEFGLSSAVAGIFGTSVNVGRAISGPLSIAPVTRFGERRMILLGGTASGVLALAAAISPAAPLVLVLLVASGIAQTVAILAGIVAVTVWFRAGGRGIAMGIRQAAVPVAGAMSAGSLPFLALELGWREALAVAGGASIATACLGTLVYRDHGQGAVRGRPEGGGAMAGLRRIAADSRLVRAIFVGSVLAAAQFVTVTYLQLFLVQDLHSSLHFAAVALAVTLVAAIAGRLVWGAVSDVVFGGRRREVLLAILVLAAGGCLGMGLAGDGAAVAVGIPMSVLLGFTTVGSPGVYLALIADLAPGGAGIAAIGIGTMFIQGSALVVPPVFGALADLTGSYRVGWIALAGVLLLTAPAARSLRGA